MMNDIKKLSFSVSPELEERIIGLRKRDEYCRLSVAEIIRQLLEIGLERLDPDPQT
jgi:hypothetical protein